MLVLQCHLPIAWYLAEMVVGWWRTRMSPSNSQQATGCSVVASITMPFLIWFRRIYKSSKDTRWRLSHLLNANHSMPPYPLESKRCCLPSSHFPHWHPLPVDAPNGHRYKLSKRCGSQEQGVIHPDHSLHACAWHNRPHTLKAHVHREARYM